jgi:hypothetical protein
MTKTIAYIALHYGKAYLAAAIQSVIDVVDEVFVLYAPEGSHGYRTDQPNPDRYDELKAQAMIGAGSKLRWFDGHWNAEHEQRNSILRLAPRAETILVLDADEIWAEGLAEFAVEQATSPFNAHVRFWRVPIIHYWRSFYRCVIDDPAFPTRVIRPGVSQPVETVLRKYTEKTRPVGQVIGDDAPLQGGREFDRRLVINHMGYAQDIATVYYKQFTHGHRGEWRRDIDWFRERFLRNAQRDCHPVGINAWNPQVVDPWAFMPGFMKDHPYATMDVIGEVA